MYGRGQGCIRGYVCSVNVVGGMCSGGCVVWCEQAVCLGKAVCVHVCGMCSVCVAVYVL